LEQRCTDVKATTVQIAACATPRYGQSVGVFNPGSSDCSKLVAESVSFSPFVWTKRSVLPVLFFPRGIYSAKTVQGEVDLSVGSAPDGLMRSDSHGGRDLAA
jgi:hypothetical protein